MCVGDERLKTKDEESMLLTYTVPRETGTPKVEINRRDVCECDG